MDDIVRIPPSNLEAERSLIGSILIEPEIIENISDMIASSDFYDKGLGSIYNEMLSLFKNNVAIDQVTLRENLSSSNLNIDKSYLIALENSVPVSVNYKDYVKIIREKALLRRLIKASNIISESCYKPNMPTDDIVDEAERLIYDIAQKRDEEEYVPMSTIIQNVLDKIDDAIKNRGKLKGLSTGFKDLDDKLNGLQKDDLVLVAARPSMGKTAFVLNIAKYISLNSESTVAFFSLEMSKEQLVNRIIALTANISAQDILSGNISDDDYMALIDKSVELANAKLIIDDTAGISLSELRRKCRKYKMNENLELVIIDYLQLMGGDNIDRQKEVSDISRALKQLARELNIPIIVLSQLNRSAEKRNDHRPMLSDIRESGAIEQDADVVMLIYREDYYNQETEEKNVAEIIIAKHRNGPVGTVKLAWIPEYTKFANLKKI